MTAEHKPKIRVSIYDEEQLPKDCFEMFIDKMITFDLEDEWISVKFEVAFENSDTDCDSWDTPEHAMDYVGGELSRNDAIKIVEEWENYLQEYINKMYFSCDGNEY